jgi:hypothetical protein
MSIIITNISSDQIDTSSELATNKSNKYNAFGLFDLRFFSARFDLFDLLYNQRSDLFDLLCNQRSDLFDLICV